MIFRVFLMVLLLCSLAGCDSAPTPEQQNQKQQNGIEQSGAEQAGPSEQQPASAKETASSPQTEQSQPFVFLSETCEFHRFESTPEALSVWKKYEHKQPALLLLSSNPHLQPTPPQLHAEIDQLIQQGKFDIIAEQALSQTANPLLLSDMTVDTALRNNWFSGTYWALPLRDAAQNLDLDTFRQQLQDAGLASESERDSLSLEQKVFTGTLRDQSFTAATLPNISLKQQPVIIHIDLSYFQPFYKNEISTPLYSIIFETMTRLKSMQLETLAVTFSYNHSDNQIALDVRFLGEMLQWLIEDPSRLEQKIPLKWQRQRDALYLANFFKKEEVRELYLAQEKDDPEAAWVKFNLYRSAVEHKEGNKALDYLSQAVELDSAYADEYFALSTLAYERGRPDESLRMLKLASNVFPNDPFVTIQMAQIANELGDKETALHLVKQLQMLVWSEFYYSDMPQYLEGFLDVIESETTQEPADSNDAEGNTETARERTLHLN